MMWNYYRDFFPIEMIKTVDLDPKKVYLIGNHPHGVLCTGAFATFATDTLGFRKKFEGITPHILTLQGQYWFPVYRELMMASGACAATKVGMTNLLQKPGHASILIVGGVLEALQGDRNKVTLVLKRRKGWIKLALINGADLVPTFSFGEHLVYDIKKPQEGSRLWKVQKWCENWMGFSPLIFQGRGIFQYR